VTLGLVTGFLKPAFAYSPIVPSSLKSSSSTSQVTEQTADVDALQVSLKSAEGGYAKLVFKTAYVPG
jgi:hypothetical protein